MYFKNENGYYILKKIDNFDITFINNIEKLNIFNYIINNKFNNKISTYNNTNYALMNIRIQRPNKIINIDDLIYIMNINFYIPMKINNYYLLWITKVEYIQEYIKEYDLSDYDINYYLGLSDIAINMIKKIDYSNISYGLVYKRFYNINEIYDLFDPFNLYYGSKVNTISEFIKYSYFYNHHKNEYEKIFKLNLNLNDYILFIARLIFPTYFFDLLGEKNIQQKYINIVNNIDGYNNFIKEIILEIKKRYKNLSFLENIINLL